MRNSYWLMGEPDVKDKILLVDKPAGWTSFDVVARIRSQLRKKIDSRSQISDVREIPKSRKIKVGHAGTLDPFATGLLIILLGDACKRADQFLKLDKTYEFTAKLGEVSTTGDPEGKISKKQNVKGKKPTLNEIEEVLQVFTGQIEQTPPAYSAIKVGGKRAYKLARAGKNVEIPARKVQVYRLELVEYSYPYLKCVCDVSSGTYIRSLVEDIGKSLDTGAYCSQLRRTRIGEYKVTEATDIDKVDVQL